MRFPKVLLLLLSIPLVPAAAQDDVTSIFPGAAEADGREGAHFSSLLAFANPGTAPADVTVLLTTYAGVPAPRAWHGTVPAGASIVMNEALPLMFGEGSFVGTLTVSTSTPLPTTLITSNVANEAGTYGLSLRPVPSSEILHRGSVGHLIWVDQNDAFRTNVGVSLLDPDSSVIVRVFDDAGNVVGQTTVSSPTAVSWQRPVSEIVGRAIAHGRIELVPTAGSVTGYVSVLDNLTSDGIALQPDRRTSEVWLLNGVSHAAGLNGTFFTTDVRIWNPGAAPLDVTFEEVGIPGGLPAQTRTIAGGAVASFDDVLASVLGAGDGAVGALRLRAAAPFLAAARTANVGAGAGTFGAFVRAVAPWELLGAGSVAVLTPVQQTSGTEGFRTNLALTAGPAGAKGKLLLGGDPGGQNPETAFELEPDQYIQRRVSSWFGPVTSLSSRFVEITVESGSLDAYASRVDNGTGDATVVPPYVLEPGAAAESSGGCAAR